MYSQGGPEPRDRFQFVTTGEILVEEFAAVGEPQPCFSELVGRQAVVVNLHVDLASVQRAADKGDVNALHAVIFAGVPGGALLDGEMPCNGSAEGWVGCQRQLSTGSHCGLLLIAAAVRL